MKKKKLQLYRFIKHQGKKESTIKKNEKTPRSPYLVSKDINCPVISTWAWLI